MIIYAGYTSAKGKEHGTWGFEYKSKKRIGCWEFFYSAGGII
jgi:hypothetical protein